MLFRSEFGVKNPEAAGKIYMKKASGASRVLYDITSPAKERMTVLIEKGTGTVFYKNTNQYRTGSASNETTDFLLLGFGAGSDVFSKSYAPEYKGREAMGGVQAAVLELTARADTAKFRKITLWLDPSTWTPVQTRVTEGSKSFTDFRYSNVKLNRGVADSVFKLDIPKDARKQ